jgi:FKBP-type peptidyl-prolyl cis-trans isomerase FkpA
MKHLIRGMVAAMTVTLTLMGSSALAQADKTTLTSEREKASYAIGMQMAHGLEQVAQYIDLDTFRKAVDNAFAGKPPLQSEEDAMRADGALRANVAASMGQPVPGLPPGSQPPAVDKAQVGLMLGDRIIGPQLLPLKDDVDLGVIFQAIRTSFAKGQPLLNDSDAQAVITAYLTRRQSEMGQKNLTEGAAFLSKNKAVAGVITTKSGLQYQVLRAGSGARPTAQSTVRVNYEGRLLDGKVFDSSYQRGEPATFPLTGVIAGWTEGIPLMSVGAKYRFWIPSELAYGPDDKGAIPPNSTLTFDVELLDVMQ